MYCGTVLAIYETSHDNDSIEHFTVQGDYPSRNIGNGNRGTGKGSLRATKIVSRHASWFDRYKYLAALQRHQGSA